ncbi:MAG: phosphoribosyl-ATP diphosphatase [Spirochaetes bacterium]|nr:phosphoribosyl-ATP diphosphatase [Spirochaetota bacterium]
MDADILDRLDAIILSRRGSDPGASYVASLLAKGPSKIRAKLVEEAAEVFEAAAEGGPEGARHLVGEAADLLFHLQVLLASRGLTMNDVRRELEKREGVGGHDEKARRSAPPAP